MPLPYLKFSVTEILTSLAHLLLCLDDYKYVIIIIIIWRSYSADDNWMDEYW
jgi:hypothetical protein